MTVFSETWNAAYEGLPPDTEVRSLGAQRIRNLKVDVRERLAVDHSWNGDANDGKHLKVTLPPLAVAPSLDAGNGALYTIFGLSGLTELAYLDSAGNQIELTSAGYIQGLFNGVTFNGTGGNFKATILTGDPYIFFNATSWITLDQTNGVFRFFINSVQVGHFP